MRSSTRHSASCICSGRTARANRKAWMPLPGESGLPRFVIWSACLVRVRIANLSRLPGDVSSNGDWHLAILLGSAEPRAALQIIQEQFVTRDNVMTLMHAGVGLSIQELLSKEGPSASIQSLAQLVCKLHRRRASSTGPNSRNTSSTAPSCRSTCTPCWRGSAPPSASAGTPEIPDCAEFLEARLQVHGHAVDISKYRWPPAGPRRGRRDGGVHQNIGQGQGFRISG